MYRSRALTPSDLRKNFMKFEKIDKANIYDPTKGYESDFTKFVRIQSEVEKIWLLYDVDDSGAIKFEDIVQYLDERAFPFIKLEQS
jgi:hypothetical protein